MTKTFTLSLNPDPDSQHYMHTLSLILKATLKSDGLTKV
jgi:hypothetical protein